jgi:hypothetical protein
MHVSLDNMTTLQMKNPFSSWSISHLDNFAEWATDLFGVVLAQFTSPSRQSARIELAATTSREGNAGAANKPSARVYVDAVNFAP